MQYFKFENSYTEHFFVWLCDTGYIDTQKLILEAFEKVEGHEQIKADKEVFSQVKNNLAMALWDIICDLTEELDVEDYSIVEVNGPKPIDMLWRPLLANAFNEIGIFWVAEALLIRAAKGAPNLTATKTKKPRLGCGPAVT